MSKNDASDNENLPKLNRADQLWTAVVQHMSLLGQQLLRYDCLTSAAALTYTTLFAVVPLMTVTLLFFSLLPEFAELGQDFQNFLFQNFLKFTSLFKVYFVESYYSTWCIIILYILYIIMQLLNTII